MLACTIIFPPKVRSGAALARRYTRGGRRLSAENLLVDSGDPGMVHGSLRRVFRAALATDNRMCLCGIMSAELDDLPVGGQTEVDKFAEMNVGLARARF